MLEPSFVEAACRIGLQLARGKVARLIARGGLRSLDRDDAIAELLGAFWQSIPRFDAQRGSIWAFASIVMDHHVVSMMRRLGAQRRGSGVDCCSLSLIVIDADGSPSEFGTAIAHPRAGLGAVDELDRAVDIRRLLARLPAGTRALAFALFDGSPSEASRSLGRSRTWIYQQLACLRQAFRSVGLAPPSSKYQLESSSEASGGIECEGVPVARADHAPVRLTDLPTTSSSTHKTPRPQRQFVGCRASGGGHQVEAH